MKELLAKIEECSRPRREYDVYERFSVLLETKIAYLTYLCMSDSFDRQHALDKSMEIINYVQGAYG